MGARANSSLWFGPLESIVRSPGVTDVALTPDGRVWADFGSGMREVKPDIAFSSPRMMRQYAVSLCAQLHVRLDDSSPIADGADESGLRIHAVIEPIVAHGAALSIRLPSQSAVSLDLLQKRGLFPQQWASLFAGFIRRRASILISGATGAGKTTLVRALLHDCPAEERIVIVEEVRELGIAGHANCVSLACRQANAEGAGEVSLTQLVRASLRMRPDRIVLGECRGGEIADLMRAFNTGHRGGLATIHADGIERVPQRLIALGQLGNLPANVVESLALGAFDVLIHIERSERGRYVSQIGFLSSSSGALAGVAAAKWDGATVPRETNAWASFAAQWR